MISHLFNFSWSPPDKWRKPNRIRDEQQSSNNDIKWYIMVRFCKLHKPTVIQFEENATFKTIWTLIIGKSPHGSVNQCINIKIIYPTMT